jgi:uncharacterized protein YcbX
MGEELNAAEVTERGLLADRAYALIDAADGKVASAQNPRKWGTLFDCRAACGATPRRGDKLPPVRITLPEGTIVSSEQSDIHRLLSGALGRAVRLERREQGHAEVVATTFPHPWLENPSLEEYWPDMEGLAHRDAVTEEKLPAGTFCDAAVLHVVTTATLDQLRALYPPGRFAVRRFRPNLVVATPAGEAGVVENAWGGKTLAIGDEVRLHVTGPCPRCVLTT